MGDTLVFEYSNSHNVYELPAGMTECPTDFFQSGRVARLRGDENASPLSISLNEDGVRTFACEVGNHCVSGQIVTVTVGESPTLKRGSSAGRRVYPVGGPVLATTLLAVTTWVSYL